jgi:hypothetical protein
MRGSPTERTVVARDLADPDEADPSDRAVNLLFQSALTLAGVANGRSVDGEAVAHINTAIEHLDAAIAKLRRVALDQLIADREVETGRNDHDLPDDWNRRLWRLSMEEIFAFAGVDHDFYRVRDRRLWAQERDGLLFSAGSGTPLARRDGNTFYDTAENVPLFFEDTRDSAT